MSETVNPEALAERALQALQGEDPRQAQKLLLEAVKAAPDRADLLNALGFVQLNLGEPELGRGLFQQAIEICVDQMAKPDRREQAEMLLEGIRLNLAAACEDLDDPKAAKATYQEILAANPGQPRAQGGLAWLLLAWGEIDAGRKELRRYVEDDRDEDPFLEAASTYHAELERFIKQDVHPREWLVAHRGSYVQMFDHYAAEQAKLGWIAEAARMKRAPDGRVVPVIPEGARPYAAVRVDLVNPNTSEVGQVGDQPMVVALADYQGLARAPVQIAWRELPFDLRISSQAPWDQLPIQLLFERPGALDDADAQIGDWYARGWDGAFGSKDAGRMHYISDPQPSREGRAVTYHVDMGRASLEAIEDLLRRLHVLHDRHAIKRVLIGRGFLP